MVKGRESVISGENYKTPHVVKERPVWGSAEGMDKEQSRLGTGTQAAVSQPGWTEGCAVEPSRPDQRCIREVGRTTDTSEWESDSVIRWKAEEANASVAVQSLRLLATPWTAAP